MATVAPGAQEQALFPEIPLKRLFRTYSHKKNRKTGLLPTLRENLPAKKRPGPFVNEQVPRFRSDSQRDQVVVIDGRSSEELRLEEEYYEEYDPEEYATQSVLEGGVQASIEGRDAQPNGYYDYSSEGPSEREDCVSSEEDAPAHSTPASSIGSLPRRRTARPPSSGPRALRRRPYLMFNKTPPPRGFKKLTPKSKLRGAPGSRKAQPGDGFSDGEARPEGLGQILGKRKLPPSAISGAGGLGLTQSSPPIQQQKKKRVKRVEDNSFLDAPRTSKRALETNISKKDKQTTKDRPVGRKASEDGAKTTDDSTGSHGARLGAIHPERNQEDNREDISKGEAGGSNTNKKKKTGDTAKAKQADSNVEVTVPTAHPTEHGVLPGTQPSARLQVEVSPAKTWDTYIEESSPFRQRCSSEEAPHTREEKDVPIMAGRVFRREKTA
ncbi:hypothetical protein B0T16DRAFT_494658 [Cercophora newfieldiana]|uniref:Uncharacterized protein n=1 Tax=Cercophora newfieldiana TaxID=92897 RepID=A0AA39Y355_9PEZI|nr:hypothetical protein B0T16DRAFT_494658 [Cercophora newfieldiana]